MLPIKRGCEGVSAVEEVGTVAAEGEGGGRDGKKREKGKKVEIMWDDSDKALLAAFKEGDDADWKKALADVRGGVGGLEKGGVAEDGIVELVAEVVGRRELGNKLVFLSLCRVGAGPKEQTSDGETDDDDDDDDDDEDRASSKPKTAADIPKEDILELVLEKTRYEDPERFRFESMLLRPGCHARFTGLPGRSIKTGDAMLYVRRAWLLRAKPHPTFLNLIMDHLKQSKVTQAQLAAWLGGVSVGFVGGLARMEKKALRNTCAKVSRVMQGRKESRDRHRASKIKYAPMRHLEACASLRAKWRPLQLGGGEEEEGTRDMVASATTGAAYAPSAYAPSYVGGGVTVSLPACLGEGELERRKAYAHGKKAPQVRWFLERLKELVSGTYTTVWGTRDGGAEPAPAVMKGGVTVLDVGGGRGDLAVNICRRMEGEGGVERVCVIDVNEQSLQAGRAFVDSLGEGGGRDRISFACVGVEQVAQIKELISSTGGRDVVVVGLHCCGGLADATVELACEGGWPFLVCPCCYLKNQQLRCWGDDKTETSASFNNSSLEEQFLAVAGIAEITNPIERTHQVSLEALETLAALRLERLASRRGSSYSIRLLQFTADYSPRNLVLAGVPQSWGSR